MCSRDYLEGALNGFILAHVQGVDELLDLVLPSPILSLAPGQLLTLLCEVGVLVQRLLVYMTAVMHAQSCPAIRGRASALTA